MRLFTKTPTPMPMNDWQRERAQAPITPASEPWYISLALWVGMIAFVACVYIIAQAYVDAQALAHAV